MKSLDLSLLASEDFSSSLFEAIELIEATGVEELLEEMCSTLTDGKGGSSGKAGSSSTIGEDSRGGEVLFRNLSITSPSSSSSSSILRGVRQQELMYDCELQRVRPDLVILLPDPVGFV